MFVPRPYRPGCFAAVMLLSLLVACGSREESSVAPEQWSYAWDNELIGEIPSEQDPEAWRPTKKIWNPTGPEAKFDGETRGLWLRAELPDFDFAEPGIYIQTFDQIATVYTDVDQEKPAYEFGEFSDGRVAFAGYPFHIIPLDRETRTVYFYIRSDHVNIGIVGQPRLDSAATLLRGIVVEDLDKLVLGCWTIFAGLFAFILFLRKRDESNFLAFAALCLAGGLYGIARTQIKQVIFADPIVWSYLEFGAFYLLPAAIYFQFQVIFGAGRFQHRLWLALMQIAYAVAALSAALMGLVPLTTTLMPAQALFLFMTTLTVGATVLEVYRGKSDARVILVGLLIGAAFSVHDILVATGVLSWSRFLSHYGLFLFYMSLGFVLILRVAKAGAMLEKTRKYLSRVIGELDSTIAFRTEALARSNEEIQSLSEIARQVNASTSLDTILERVFAYFQAEFAVEAAILQLIDRDTNELYSYSTTEPENATPEMIAYSRNLRVKLDESSGIIYKTYQRKRTFYLAKLDNRAFPAGAEREIVDTLQLKSFVLVPVAINEEVIAMILLTSYNKHLSLSRDDIRRIDRFAEQVAGAINHANLLQRARTAVDEARAERLRANDARYELEALNKFAREISSNTDLDEILEKIFYYVISQFGLHGCYLYLRDEDKNELYHYKSMLPDSIDPAKATDIENRRVDLDSESVLARVARRGRPLYLPRFRQSGGTDADEEGIDSLGLSAMYIVPLVVQDQVSGMIVFSNFDSPMMLRKPELESIARFCEQLSGAVRTASLLSQVEQERKKSDRLLLNVLPEAIAEELKQTGKVNPQSYESATVLFTDFKGFTSRVERRDPRELIVELDQIFEQFDHIVEKSGLEKLKTIGDAYMCAGGLPNTNSTHAVDACLAALEVRSFMAQTREIKRQLTGEEFWELRIGINTGSVVAGVVGKNKFVYDVWGDAVNVASRMETNSEPGEINISRSTYEEIKYFFACDYRGQVPAKNRGMLDMYFLKSIRPELSMQNEGLVPNERFHELYARVQSGARLRFRSELEDGSNHGSK
ncbi:MAG: GAF domain-containing protein [bacterium]|nr:GAF domain-containing protein [bacterium]